MTRVLTSGQAVTSDKKARARERAVREGIEVRQIKGSDFWIATSGRKGSIAYPLTVKDGQVVDCGCQAGTFGNYCKHKAAFELSQERQGENHDV
jgi:hypothetical protein